MNLSIEHVLIGLQFVPLAVVLTTSWAIFILGRVLEQVRINNVLVLRALDRMERTAACAYAREPLPPPGMTGNPQ